MKRILVIDDEINLGKLIKLNLELTGGFEVTTAVDGARGMILAKNVKPDLILLDILMPKMDGFEALKRLKEDKDTADIPVIMLTAKGDEASMAKAGRLCDEFITKPIEASDLRIKIEEVLKKKGKRVLK